MNATDSKPKGRKTSGRPTLKTISELTGFSLSTVSLALRDDNSLKVETRAKVRKIAREVGYIPDRAGVRLRTGKTNVIALVLPSDQDSSGFSGKLIQGIGAGLQDTNYHLSVMPQFEADGSVENVRYIMENHTADGIILTHTTPRDARVKLMMDSGFHFVTNGRTEFFSHHPFHDIHGENFARLAAQRLIAVGSKKLMLIIGDDGTMNRQNIVNAFNRTIAEQSVSGQVLAVTRDENLAETMDRILGEDGRAPDGYICNEEFMGVILCHANLRNNLRGGHYFHIVSRESSGILPMLFPQTDTIEDDLFAMGKELVRILILQIQGETNISRLQTLGEPIPRWRADTNGNLHNTSQ